ncbi:MAG TPA: amidase [bacterium]|nr:amidase [bacterium]
MSTGEPAVDDRYDEYGLAALQTAMDGGQLSSSKLVAYYRSRIDALDSHGPELKAVLQVNAEAETIAIRLDEERAHGHVRGPLHGIPIMLKANINTGDGMATTAGSLALHGFCPGRDAAFVRRLRDAGAVILGKTNLSEWANFRSTHSSSGWSSEGGQTRNPYAPDRSPGGSSSGSAVAVSANLCAAAVGTETDGSIISPASFNSIVGIKPTIGLVSQEGIIPISKSQDTAGPMARTVTDAAIMLAAMAEPEALARMRSGLVPGPVSGLAGVRLGFAPSQSAFLPSVTALMHDAMDVLSSLGAELVEVALPDDHEMEAAELELMLYEIKDGLRVYLSSYGYSDGPRTIDDIMAFNREHAGTVMPWFGQELFERAAGKGPLDDPAYLRAKEICRTHSRDQGIDRVMDLHRLDAIIGPSGGPPWKVDHLLGDHCLGGTASYPAVAGYPNITVPAGFIHGLPVGLSVFGRAYSEPVLIGIAMAFESATSARRKPGLAAAS